MGKRMNRKKENDNKASTAEAATVIDMSRKRDK